VVGSPESRGEPDFVGVCTYGRRSSNFVAWHGLA
jgi:hypothetical protein